MFYIDQGRIMNWDWESNFHIHSIYEKQNSVCGLGEYFKAIYVCSRICAQICDWVADASAN